MGGENGPSNRQGRARSGKEKGTLVLTAKKEQEESRDGGKVPRNAAPRVRKRVKEIRVAPEWPSTRENNNNYLLETAILKYNHNYYKKLAR